MNEADAETLSGALSPPLWVLVVVVASQDSRCCSVSQFWFSRPSRNKLRIAADKLCGLFMTPSGTLPTGVRSGWLCSSSELSPPTPPS